MVFSSIEFLFLFLPLFFLFYVFVPYKNFILFFASLLFYFVGEGYYALILLGCVGYNYGFGLLIMNAPEAQRRFALAAGITLNLLILFWFKYSGFFVYDIFQMDPDSELPIPRLPIGISFFTFQAISYLVDIYRRETAPSRSVLDLGTYITMFPQLVAGPIVRYSTVARRIRARSVNLRHVYHGGLYFTFGLAQKVLIADKMAEVVDPVFALQTDQLTTALAWVGALTYTMQIYFDFAGYSNMAIGIGLLLGFRFPRNFNYPYLSRSITEFWRRWHMSLSSWFRDYLYIPLGGNRLGPLKTYRNLFAVFVLCGLWHGAAWTFVAWGVFHGLLLTVERFLRSSISISIPVPVAYIYSLMMTVIGWVIFRSETFEQAAAILKAMAGFSTATELAPNPEVYLTNMALVTFLVAIPASLGLVEKIAKRFITFPSRWVSNPNFQSPASIMGIVCAVTLFMLCSIYILSGSYSAFIYFQF